MPKIEIVSIDSLQIEITSMDSIQVELNGKVLLGEHDRPMQDSIADYSDCILAFDKNRCAFIVEREE